SASRPVVGFYQRANARLDVVADLAHALARFALRIFERPVVALGAGDDRALVAAAHRDQSLGLRRQLDGELLRLVVFELEPVFAHDRDDLGMHALAWRGAGGDRA